MFKDAGLQQSGALEQLNGQQGGQANHGDTAMDLLVGLSEPTLWQTAQNDTRKKVVLEFKSCRNMSQNQNFGGKHMQSSIHAPQMHLQLQSFMTNMMPQNLITRSHRLAGTGAHIRETMKVQDTYNTRTRAYVTLFGKLELTRRCPAGS